MKIVPVIFTYSKDGACAAEAAGALKEAGFGEVVVFEDARHPVSDSALEGIGKTGARILPSTHPNPTPTPAPDSSDQKGLPHPKISPKLTNLSSGRSKIVPVRLGSTFNV
jgi:hypothetical protein